MPPHVAGEGMPFMIVNRGKRSIALDLQRKDDLVLCRRLTVEADVFVENSSRARRQRSASVGLHYGPLNPRLV